MPKKRNGFPYEVHPTPAKGKDGKNIVYAKPARGLKMSAQGMDDFCAKHYALKNGELQLVMNTFIRAAAELMSMGYRIDFAHYANITTYSARKQLNAWTKGKVPRLMKSSMGQQDIYTEL
jgi:hypothetical protein